MGPAEYYATSRARVRANHRRFRDFRFQTWTWPRAENEPWGIHHVRGVQFTWRRRCTHASAYRRGMRDSLHILPSFSYPSPVSPVHSLCRFVNRSRNSATVRPMPVSLNENDFFFLFLFLSLLFLRGIIKWNLIRFFFFLEKRRVLIIACKITYFSNDFLFSMIHSKELED